MKIGIKYCGGCNPQYDRKNYTEYLINKYPDNDYEIAREDTFYDVLLVICGCFSCCAAYNDYNYNTIIKEGEYKLEISELLGQ